MARRRSKGRGRRTRSAAKKPAQRSRQRTKRTIVIIKRDGWGYEPPTIHREVYEEEW